MKHLSRPFQSLHRGVPIALALAVFCLIAAPRALEAQAKGVMSFFANPFPSLSHTSQGYLGVDLGDVDQEKAQQLKLKDVRGAVITLIDHDAPAGKIGLKVNDVILSINGQAVEGAEQLKRMLREIPAGRKVSLEISRDGNIQTIAVELADREAMERDVWDKIDRDGDLISPAPGTGFLGANGDVTAPPGFHMPFFGPNLKVGALVEPLTSQMAEYLGVTGGLMVKQVTRKSEAANAGLRAFDVILKVANDPMATIADWERALRSNVGKQVPVTILRDKKQQTLNLQVDSKHHSGELEWYDIFGDGDPDLVAEDDLGMPEELEAQSDAAAAQAQVQQQVQANEQLRKQLESQAEALRNQIQSQEKGLSQQQAEELRKQAEKLAQQAAQFGQQFKEGQFQFDQKQMEQLRQQLEQFKVDPQEMQKLQEQLKQFKVDPEQMEQLRQQMEQFQKSFNSDQFKKQFQMNQQKMKELQQQMKQFQDQFKDQLEYLREQQSGHFV